MTDCISYQNLQDQGTEQIKLDTENLRNVAILIPEF